jgi:hypothetical protein
MIKALLLAASITLLASQEKCRNKKPAASTCFKGKLAIKAGCMNYTIQLLEGTMDTSLLVNQWTDESTGKSYRNVFALGSKCNFPAGINEGDEFYFTIDSTTVQNCAVCMMYYPTPPKSLRIKAGSIPCSPQH